MVIYFHSHLKCRHIHDKKGAIEVDLLKSSRMNYYHCYYLKLHQINMNRQDLYLCCKNLRKWSYIFIITSNVGMFMTKKLLLKLIFWNQVGWIFIIATIWNCIKLIWIDQDLYLCCKNLRKWSYIFIITSNVGTFMTKKVLLKLIFWNQVGWIFIIATIWNGIKLMWIDRICIFVGKNLRKWSYIFIITLNVGIFMTKKVLLKFIFWNQVEWIFIIATIWNCIKLIWIDRICIFVARI